jgi:hypothetical protein
LTSGNDLMFCVHHNREHQGSITGEYPHLRIDTLDA